MENCAARDSRRRDMGLIQPFAAGRVGAEYLPMAATELAIEVDGLTRRFPRCEALGGVSFQVPRGELTGILGPNASGKTTLLLILTGLLVPTTGRVRVAGFDPTTQWLEVRRRIGFLPENVPLYPEMRVQEYLAFRGRLKGLRGKRLAERIRQVLEPCGLGEMARRPIGTLSRGFRQRVGMADCLLTEPEILLLDEPLAGLDAGQTQRFHEMLREQSGRRTILFSTHVLAEAEQLCQRVLVLNGGRLAANDTPAQLAAATPTGSFTDAFLRLTTLPPRVQNPRGRSAR